MTSPFDSLHDSHLELQHDAALLGRLHRLTLRLAATPDTREALLHVLHTAVDGQRAQYGLLSLFDDTDGFLHVWASIGFDTEALGILRDVPPGAGACGHSFSTKARVIVEDAEADPLFASFVGVARRVGFRAVHSAPILTRAGEILGVLSVHYAQPTRPSARDCAFADMCARHAADALETARSHKRLMDSDRRKDAFIAQLAHELRNPLAPIVSAVRLLALSSDTAIVEKSRAVIERQTNHLVRLVDDLLDISRITTGKLQLQRERVDVRDAVAAGIETARPHIDARGHRLTTRIPSEPICVLGDAARLSQVFSNLLNNAAKYTPNGGDIVLSMAVADATAIVTVADTGVGLSPRSARDIFEPFTQGEGGTPSGLGIGLALVRRIVEMHGGSVDAESAGPGQGSVFSVRLPCTSQAVSRKEEGDVLHVTTMSRRVLVVDDNRDAADTLAAMLVASGHDARAVYEGQEALVLLDEYKPDVVLLDLGMPGMNGFEVAKHIRARQNGRSITLAAVTGWDQASAREQTAQAGFDLHLVKPVSVRNLTLVLGSRTRLGYVSDHLPA